MINQIVKRVIVYVVVAIILGFLSKHFLISNVYASVLSHQSSSFNTVVQNVDTLYNYNITGSPFANRGQGEVHFSVVLNKVSGTPTAPIVMIRNVYISDNNSLFYCSLGTSSLTNSTFGGTVYSLTCPVDNISSVGLKSVRFDFADNQQNDTSSYRFTFGGLFTYVSTSISNNVNVDTSGTTNAINNQITNDNANTNRIINSQQQTTTAINDLNDTLTDDNVDDSIDTAEHFMENLDIQEHGLSTLVTSPLRLIQSFTSATCTPLSFSLPFIHDNVTIPCMKAIIQQNFGVFFVLYQMITTGLIAYRIWLNLLSLVHNLQDPFYSRIAVINL